MSEPKIPTTQEIKDSIISNIEQNINQDTPLMQKAFNRVLAGALAGILTLVYKFGHWIFKQIFTQTQDLDSLKLEGEELGIYLKTAVTAQLDLTVTGDESATITTGTRFYNSATGLVYELTEDITIAIGETTGTGVIECLTAGAAGNMENGIVISLVSPFSGFENDATVGDIVVDGSDEEDTEDYRARILQAKRNRPQGAAIADYVKRALEVSEITRAFAFQTAAGVVTVYSLVDDNETSRIPNSAKLTELQDYLRDESWKPLNDTVYAGSFVETEFDVTITSLDPDTTDIRSLIESNIETWLLAREPQQYAGQTEVSNIVSTSLLTNIVINSGGVVFTLTFEITGSGTPLTSYILADNEICKLGTLTFA